MESSNGSPPSCCSPIPCQSTFWQARNGALTGTHSVESLERSYRNVWTKNNKGVNCCCAAVRREAGQQLALLLLQSNRDQEADVILQELGYTFRIASSILNYPRLLGKSSVESTSNTTTTPLCYVYDDYLNEIEFQWLKDCFLDPKADYWTRHNYAVAPQPSPYFSYLLPLQSTSSSSTSSTALGGLVQRLYNTARTHWPAALRHATTAELWAHNRPAVTGHQFHFDSDNEGCTDDNGDDDGEDRVRHPIVSCVLYLSSTGGPTVVTSQRLASPSLARTARVVPPVARRLIVLDGKLLHGVVPGVAQEERNHRVTLMVAFWPSIRERHTAGQAACAWPSSSSPPPWARQLTVPAVATTGCSPDPRVVTPVAVSPVYESVVDSGRPWTRIHGFPDYEQIFQGV